MARRKRYNRGRWAIERERGGIVSFTPPDSRPTTDSISDVIPAIMKKLGLESEQWTGILEREWEELIGSTVAAHTRPGRYKNGKLIVFVDSATWLNELKRFNQGQMLKNLQARFGAKKIRSLALQPDPGVPD
jgi:predicted nucleic acid-binding Zn ribbon protein